jgi:hypothetical protein
MSARAWAISDVTPSRLIRASALIGAMLLLSSQAALAQFEQDGKKLVGMLATGPAQQGSSVSLSGDGDTAIVGGPWDNSEAGAAWVFTRSGGVWSQQGRKLVGAGAVGSSRQGASVALSADGDTAIVGGYCDNSYVGAAWVFTRSGGVWKQQGGKLVGAGAVGEAQQGASVALSADGDTAFVGGPADNGYAGAAWVYTRSGDVWTQQGGKLVGTDAGGEAEQGWSVALSADGDTAIVGGYCDNGQTGAAWVFVQPLQVSPYSGIAASGTKGGPFSPSSFSYKLRATSGRVKYSIAGAPSWLTASSTSGTLTTAWTTIALKVNASADKLAAGAHVGAIEFNNADGKQATIVRPATLTVKPKEFTITVEASPAADGSVSGGGVFAQGTSDTVKAAAHYGYEFLEWWENGKKVSASASYTFTVEANVTLVASFLKKPADGAIE